MKNRLKENRKLYYIVSVCIALILIISGSALLGPKLIHTINDPESFRTYIESRGVWGYLIFIGIQFLQVVFAFIPGEVVEIAAGYAFGAWLGLALSLVGVFLATVTIFYATKTFAKNLAISILENEKINRLKFLKNKRRLHLIFFILYFLPGTPKDVLTYFAGLTKVEPRVFIMIATFARIPSVLTSTFAGHTLVEKDYISSIIIFSVTAIIGILGLIIYDKIISKRQNRK